MYEDPVTTGASAAEVVEELLRQLVDARFVLTDRDGSVTRWSRPAEELFGWPAPRMLGRRLVEALRLDAELPDGGGQVQATAMRKDGHELEVVLTLVPVSMSQSLEFNGFLEALEIAAPRGNALAQLQQSHHTVVEWIHAAVAGEAHLEEDVLSAGTIVAFRAVGALPPPLPSAETEPTKVGPATNKEVAEAVDAARVRSDDIERALEQTAAELAEARTEAEGARAEAAEAAERLVELEESGAGLQTGLADAHRALEEMRAELETVHSAVDGMRRDLAGGPEAQERLEAHVDQTRSRLAALEGALSKERGLGEWVNQAQARMVSLEAALAQSGEAQSAGEAVSAELADARARLRQIETERTAERERLGRELETVRERLQHEYRQAREQLGRELAEARERLEQELAGERAQGTDSLVDQLGETRARVQEIERAGDQERRELAEEQAATAAKLEALEQALAADRGRREGETRLHAELEELRGRVEDLGENTLKGKRLRRELEETRALVDGLGVRIEQVQVDAIGDEEARRLFGDLRAELAELRSGADAGVTESEELRAATQEARDAAASVRETQSAVERLVQSAEDAVELARGHSSEAAEAAGAVGDRLARAEQALDVVETEAKRAQRLEDEAAKAQQVARATLATIDARAAEVNEALAAIEAGAERARAHADRAREASGTGEGHAGRAGEHAHSSQTAAQRVDAAVDAAERRAQQAEQAAAAAAEAAAIARRSAEEAGSDAAAMREAMESDERYDLLEPPQAAVGGTGIHRPLFKRPRGADGGRERRPGFDDVASPMATIGLDGHFRQLNRAFTDLVGYPESEFAAATWPPVMDRANLPKHREQIEQMLAGAIDSAEVNTGYVHAQGLLVPVAGTIKLVKEDGEPDHFLLEVIS